MQRNRMILIRVANPRNLGKPGGNLGTGTVFSGIVPCMARLPRVVIVDVAHHVTQRGNGRHFILDNGKPGEKPGDRHAVFWYCAVHGSITPCSYCGCRASGNPAREWSRVGAAGSHDTLFVSWALLQPVQRNGLLSARGSGVTAIDTVGILSGGCGTD
jgi:hypothetical protein